MTIEGWITLAVIAVCLGLMAADKTAPSVVLFGGAVFLMLVGVIDTPTALAGFSNPAPFTVAALYVVARAIEKTGGLQPLVRGTLGGSGGPTRRLLRLLWPVGASSAFLNNTPIVAMLTPQVSDYADREGEPASWYLMPLSFAAILGGLVTVIGTSTTVVVSGLLESVGEAPLSMFAVTPLGLPIAVAGIGLLAVLAPRVLPARRASRRQFSDDVREFTVNMRVTPGGDLVGRSVEDAGLRHLKGVFLAGVHRDDEVIVPVGPELILRGGDLLTFAGQADQVLDLQSKGGLQSAELEHAVDFHGAGHTYFEAVIGPASPLVGTTLRDVDFRRRYQAAVLAIHRAGQRVPAKLGSVRLQAGDTLRIIADSAFKERWLGRTDFLLVAGIGGMAPTRSREAGWVVAIIAGIVLLSASGLLPILHAALLGAILVPALGILTPAECRRAVDLDVVMMIASAFGIGAAMEVSGLAQVIADLVFGIFAGWGAGGTVFGLVAVTVILTELVTNNAAAILVFPIAMSVAQSVGAEPTPFAIAVALAASASFLTPIGYQTNTMVYGPGGYRFADYARLGAPLTVMVAVMISVLVPTLWL